MKLSYVAIENLKKLKNFPFWNEGADFEEISAKRPELVGEIQADIGIIGAGFTGLWTAYYLLKENPNLKIVLIEQKYVSFGASGRNGGWCSAIFPVSLSRIAKQTSKSKAIELQKQMNLTIDEIKQVVNSENIDADFEKNGYLALARSKAHYLNIVETVNSSKDFGLPDQWKILSREEAKNKINATDIQAGLFTEHMAVIHPGKLARNLANLVESLGAKIYQNTKMTSFKSGQIITENGKINCENIVLATEAFRNQISENARKLIPIYSSMIATEVLPIEIKKQIGQRIAFNDMRHLRVYSQLTADGRLVFGGRGTNYLMNSKLSVDSETSDSHNLRLLTIINEFFPFLKDIKITHRWGGPLAIARDFHPCVQFDKATGIGWAGSYAGDGVATSNLSGRILRNLILNIDDSINHLPLVDHQSPNWEIEPLRWIFINGALFANNLADYEENLTNRSSYIARILEKFTGAH